MPKSSSDHDQSKRQLVKIAAYVAPLILTLKATPSFAGMGSSGGGGNGNGRDDRPKRPGR